MNEAVPTHAAAPTIETALRELPLVAILRAATAERFPAVARALAESGVRAIEVTMTTAGAAEAIAALVADPALRGVALGAGTVVTPELYARARDAGAGYLVTPAVVPDVLAAAARDSVPVVCGAFTATEVLTAHEAGARWVKLFPASLGGPSYLRALRAPLPHVRFVPTGGVDVRTVGSWFDAGAAAVAAGSPLVGDACEPEGDLVALCTRARAFVQATRDAVAGAPA